MTQDTYTIVEAGTGVGIPIPIENKGSGLTEPIVNILDGVISFRYKSGRVVYYPLANISAIHFTPGTEDE